MDTGDKDAPAGEFAAGLKLKSGGVIGECGGLWAA